MYVNQVNLDKSFANYKKLQNKPQQTKDYPSGIQTSLYNTRGMNVYFGSLAKGVDFIENECIDILRSARNGRCRRFAENDIQDIVNSLKYVAQPENKPYILQELLMIGDSGKLPDNKLFKRLVALTANRPENERFAILEFAANELENATKPMEVFSKLPFKTQNNLTDLLCKIDYVNDSGLYKSDEARALTVNSLYDTFRVPLYAHEDMDKLPREFRILPKKENLKILDDDLKFYEKQDVYKDEFSRQKVLYAVECIRDYFNRTF